MKTNWLFAGLVSFCLVLGCSREEDTDVKLDTEDPTFYAGRIKAQVNEVVNSAGKSTQRAAEQGSVLLEELEVYETQPVGSHKETYAKLLEKCKALVAAGKAGSSSDVSAALKEMKKLADSLPGE